MKLKERYAKAKLGEFIIVGNDLWIIQKNEEPFSNKTAYSYLKHLKGICKNVKFSHNCYTYKPTNQQIKEATEAFQKDGCYIKPIKISSDTKSAAFYFISAAALLWNALC